MPFLKRGSQRSSGPPAGQAPAGDAELVHRTLRGQSDAFGLLYERHADRIFRYLFFRVQDRDLAHDLAQDVFLSALRALPQLQHPERFEGWLVRIAHNRVVNHWTRGGPRSEAGSYDALSETEGDGRDPWSAIPAEPGAGDPATVDDRLQFEHLLGGGLNPTQHQVLALRFAAGLSLRETAEILGCSENAAKQHQYRALSQLRLRLKPAQPKDAEDLP